MTMKEKIRIHAEIEKLNRKKLKDWKTEQTQKKENK